MADSPHAFRCKDGNWGYLRLQPRYKAYSQEDDVQDNIMFLADCNPTIGGTIHNRTVVEMGDKMRPSPLVATYMGYLLLYSVFHVLCYL